MKETKGSEFEKRTFSLLAALPALISIMGSLNLSGTVSIRLHK